MTSIPYNILYKREQYHLLQILVHKKQQVAYDLIIKVYGDDLKEHKMCRDTGLFQFVFKNKPDQPLQIRFTKFDTWDKIKMKMNKLRDSDGICVVCCIMQKKSEGEVVNICESCCEYTCYSCISQFTNTKCPVCRECIFTYIHKEEKKDCDCDKRLQESDSDNE